MTAPRSIAPTLHTGHSAQVVDRREAIVLETHQSRCTLLSINGQSVAVPPEDVKAPRATVIADTQLELNSKNIRTEAEELCVFQGREIHLN